MRILAEDVAACLTIAAALFVGCFVQPVPSLLVPVVASMTPFVFRTPRSRKRCQTGALIVLLGFSYFGMFTVGILFIPGAVAMGVALAVDHPRSHT